MGGWGERARAAESRGEGRGRWGESGCTFSGAGREKVRYGRQASLNQASYPNAPDLALAALSAKGRLRLDGEASHIRFGWAGLAWEGGGGSGNPHRGAVLEGSLLEPFQGTYQLGTAPSRLLWELLRELLRELFRGAAPGAAPGTHFC